MRSNTRSFHVQIARNETETALNILGTIPRHKNSLTIHTSITQSAIEDNSEPIQ